MSEWTTDLQQARPGWLVQQECTGVDDLGTFEVTKGGRVLECLEHKFRVCIATPLGEDEFWWFGYGGHGMKLKVRAPDGE